MLVNAESDPAKSGLLARMSNEMRTPHNKIIGCSFE
jgi:hypothetical protein